MRRLLFTAALVALVSGGCGAGRAKSPSAPTPLDVPSPPPRVIVPPEPEVPRTPPPQPTDASTKPKPTPAKPVAPKPETRIEPPPAADIPTVPAPPPPILEQKLPTSAAEARKQVQEQIGRAEAALRRIKRDTLTADEQSQFDTATQFIAQAKQASNEGNLVFAAKVAEKAVALATGLRVR